MCIARRLTLFAAILTCGCMTTSTRQYRAAEELKVREAVLLEYLAFRATNRVVFVSFLNPDRHHVDASDEAISRLRAAGIPARKASESTWDDQSNVIDQATRGPGIVYYAGVLKWLGNSKIEVITGTMCGSLCGGFTEFVMKRENGKWRFAKEKMRMTY